MPAAAHRYNLTLLCSFGLIWLALAFGVEDRQTWMLENALTVAFVALLVFSHRRLPLSRLSYTLVFAFLCLHAVGAHYTYSLVPYDDWARALGAGSVSEWMGWQRNHYDRLVHFAFGLLLGYPAREVLVRVAAARGFWGYFLPLILMMALSLLYEMIEWGAAVVFGGDLGMHYLGTQGDVWDGHRDMGLATLGALLAMTLTAAVNGALQRDFAREWHASLQVKVDRPLGEEAVRDMLAERRQPGGQRSRRDGAGA